MEKPYREYFELIQLISADSLSILLIGDLNFPYLLFCKLLKVTLKLEISIDDNLGHYYPIVEIRKFREL